MGRDEINGYDLGRDEIITPADPPDPEPDQDDKDGDQ